METEGAAIERVDLFRSMSAAAREAISQALRPCEVVAGEWLFRGGEPGDALYIVRSGRLELVANDGDTDLVVRLRGPGAVIGELALLDGEPRATSVRAVRDTTLWKLDRADFARLRQSEPSLADGLLRVMTAKLRQTGDVVSQVPAMTQLLVVATVGSGAATSATSDALIDALGSLRAMAVLDASTDDDRAQRLDEAERDHALVVLRTSGAADASSSWSAWCHRQTDQVVLVADAAPASAVLDRLGSADVVASRRGGAGDMAWLSQVAGRVLVIRDGAERGPDAARAARHLTGDATGLVLSGGGARGFAHIGVLDEIERRGSEVDSVGGTSIGAFIGALYASGRRPEEIEAICRSEFASVTAQWVLPTRRRAHHRSQRLGAILRRQFGDATIESLPIPFFCVSADLVSAEVVVHRRGDLADAVQASMSLPGVFSAIEADERLLVDGGVLNNLPIDVMAAGDAGRILAVDVMGRGGRNAVFAPDTNEARRAPTTLETLARTAALGSWRWTAGHRGLADVLINPEVQSIGLLDFDQIDQAVRAGRAAARAVLTT